MKPVSPLCNTTQPWCTLANKSIAYRKPVALAKVANRSQAPGAVAVLFVYHVLFANLLMSFYQPCSQMHFVLEHWTYSEVCYD